jgi:hypothetical protein
MNPKLPSRIMVTGMLALALSLAAKLFLPFSILGRSPSFEWGCGIVTALAFSAGMFLSLCGLLGQTDRRRAFFALHLIGLLTFCAMLSLYFLGYIVMTKTYDETARVDVLPKLIENARNADSESSRKEMAEDAYKLYGATLAYRLDSGALAYYQPTGEDTTFHDNYEQNNLVQDRFRRSLGEEIRQFPWLFVFYLGSFFTVYLVGTLWLLFRKPEPRS